MNRAAIDLGSNMAQMLMIINGREYVVQDFTALGDKTATSGILSKTSMDRTLQVLKKFKDLLDNASIKTQDVIFYATEACRMAKNREFFFNQIKVLGFNPQLISAKEESFLSSYALVFDQIISERVITLDIGGASTEITLLNSEKKIIDFMSFKMGTLLASNLVKFKKQNVLMMDFFSSHSEQLKSFKERPLLCTRGTMTTIFNLVKNNQLVDEKNYHLEKVDGKHIMRSLEVMNQFSTEEIISKFPWIKQRLKTLPGAMAIVYELLNVLSPVDVTLIDRGLMHAAIQQSIKI